MSDRGKVLPVLDELADKLEPEHGITHPQHATSATSSAR